MTTPRINKDDFIKWRDDEITQAFFKALKEQRKIINEQLTSSILVMKEGSGKQGAYLIGKREGLDLMLQVKYDDIEEDEESKNGY